MNESTIDHIQPGLLRDALASDAQLLEAIDTRVVLEGTSHIQMAINICYVPFSGRTIEGYRKKLRSIFC
jgi:hypothetical protein